VFTVTEPIKQKFNISHDVIMRGNTEVRERLDLHVPSISQTASDAGFELLAIRHPNGTDNFTPRKQYFWQYVTINAGKRKNNN
jgi:hypothetical protein